MWLDSTVGPLSSISSYNGERGIQVDNLVMLSSDELSKVEANWERSEECRKLRERQAALREKIETKTAAYSKRC